MENFVPGALESKGLDYQSLREKCPSLIYCSITGFGPDGPYKTRYELIGYVFNLNMDVGNLYISACGELRKLSEKPPWIYWNLPFDVYHLL